MISVFNVYDIRMHEDIDYFVIRIDDSGDAIVYRKIKRLEVSEDHEGFYNVANFLELRTNNIYNLKYFKLKIYKCDVEGISIENIKWVRIFHE